MLEVEVVVTDAGGSADGEIGLAVVAATIVEVVQPTQVVDVLVLAYNAEIDEFAIVDDAAVLKGIEVITGVVVLDNTDVAEVVAF